MRVLAHISDVHFNDVSDRLLESLAVDLHETRPDVLVVSGDLTQRARRKQFARAAEYLSRLPGRKFIVPGNHDVPLFDVLRRFLWPLERYRRYVCDDLSPVFVDDELAMLGLNTARSLTWWWDGFWRDGRISREQAGSVRQFFGGVRAGVFRILVTHHPFAVPPRHPRRRIVHNARAALAAIAGAGGVDLLMAGHLHTAWCCELCGPDEPAGARRMVCALAGTAVSTRIRREPNCYNIVAVNAADFTVATRTWTGRSFEQSTCRRFVRQAPATVPT